MKNIDKNLPPGSSIVSKLTGDSSLSLHQAREKEREKLRQKIHQTFHNHKEN